jgi:hypothetical protein
MPIIHITDDTDWITDSALVDDFIRRLETCIDSSVEFERDIPRGMLKNVQEQRRYSQKMWWMLGKLEDLVESANDPPGFFGELGGES